MRHRAHGKMHKSVDVLKLQMEQGGAIGVCCQKVSEAEVFARAGIKDILVSNQVRDPAKIDRLARLPKITAAAIIVCVDDVANVADLSAAAQKHGTDARRLRRDRLRRRPLRRDHDAGRGRDRQGRRRRARPALPRHPGLPGRDAAPRQATRTARPSSTPPSPRSKDAVEALKEEGLEPELVSGGGTGSYYFECELGRLQRAAVRLLRLHGRRLRPHPRQGRQAHRPGRVGERALHPDERDEPRQARQGDLRRRPQGAVGRLGPAVHLRPRRREVHQVLRRARRHRGHGAAC